MVAERRCGPRLFQGGLSRIRTSALCVTVDNNGVVQLKYGDTINIFICMNYGGGVSRKKQMVSKGLALFNKSLRLHLVVALQTASRNAGFHFLRPLGRASSS